MTKRTQTIILILMSIALFAVWLLASGLPGLYLIPGKTIPMGNRETTPPMGIQNLRLVEIIFLFIRGMLALGLVLLPVYILINLLTPKGRRRLLRDLVTFTYIFVILYFIYRFTQTRMPPEAETVTQYPPPSLSLDMVNSATGGKAFSPAQVPTYVNWLVYGGLVILIAIIVTGILLALYKLRQRQPDALEQLAQEAKRAVDGLSRGTDFRDTIIRCYLHMCNVLGEERGIFREEAVTPREFVLILEGKGFPSAPVQQLTSLFEEVRYGNKQFGKKGELQAVDSLNAIIDHCRRRL